jgi:hypothetical protein
MDFCAHCGATDVQHQVDNFQCLACGRHTQIGTNLRVVPDDQNHAPSPAAQRIMHQPGPNHGVDPVSLQVGEAEWGDDVDPTEWVVPGDSLVGDGFTTGG